MEHGVFQNLPVESLSVSAQVRKQFDEASLIGLTLSLKQTGMLQPILAARRDGKLVIVFGERRWRAAKKAGLVTVPVLILENGLSEPERLVAQLSENLQRAQLAHWKRLRESKS